jgi:hypothetical protein
MGSTPLRLQVDIEEQQAADAEYASWIDRLENERDVRCPDGRMHTYRKASDPDSIYCWHCPTCGHHSTIPF